MTPSQVFEAELDMQVVRQDSLEELRNLKKHKTKCKCKCKNPFSTFAKKDNEEKGVILDQNHLYTALEKTLASKSKEIRDSYMKILESSNELCVSDFANDQKDVEVMLKQYSSNLHNFFQNRMNETSLTQNLTEFTWPSQTTRELITFRQDTPVLSQ